MTQRKKILLAIATAILFGGCIYGGWYGYTIYRQKLEKQEIGVFGIKLFKSQGARDETKEEKYVFSPQDPIQAEINFQNVSENHVLLFSLSKKDSKDSSVQELEMPVQGEEGRRYVSLVKNLKSGQYIIQLREGETLLSETEFTVE